ncbi:hypothetical protein AHiyo8_58450 [Arthrobacter sp. Hiyo8]|nr:hypothetical protein AHiyo8_58450 [Arthrobacter sp. Hiyo8]
MDFTAGLVWLLVASAFVLFMTRAWHSSMAA